MRSIPHLVLSFLAALALSCLFVAPQIASARSINPKVVASTPPLIIDEFRLRDGNGGFDEYVEIYNQSGADFTVMSTDGSGGYALAANDTHAPAGTGVVHFIIPDGTVIPNRGHFLGACQAADTRSGGYSLSGYPAGDARRPTATPDVTYSNQIPDNTGIALFSTANPALFNPATELDAVGPDTETNPLFKEGTGYQHFTTILNTEYAWHRQLSSGTPQDTNNNATDFAYVDTLGHRQRSGANHATDDLGAPGPKNLGSPVQMNDTITPSKIDPGCTTTGTPTSGCQNTVYDPTPAGTNAPYGTLQVRRTFTNNTGKAVSRLRFRIVDITTGPEPKPTDSLHTPPNAPTDADLRALTSTNQTVTLSDGMTMIAVDGTTLEQPPNQPIGGGFNSSLSDGTVTLAQPVPPGGKRTVNFLLGVKKGGPYRFFVNVEALTCTSTGSGSNTTCSMSGT